MKQFIGWPIWLIIVALSVLSVNEANALEGALTTDHKDWSGAEKTKQPTDAEREKELEARKADMEATKKLLEARIGRAVKGEQKEAVRKALRKVHADFGWEPKLQLVYGRRSIEPILNEQDEMPPELLKAFIQLNKDLKDRGVDLILLPLAPTPFFAAHEMVEGVGPEDEIYPGWSKMMLQLIENDIEVVDSLDAYRKEARNPILVSWANDFHTGSLGRQLAAKELAKRLQRYEFARELKANRDKWQVNIKERTGTAFPQRITTVNRFLVTVPLDSLKPGQVNYAPGEKNKRRNRAKVLHPNVPKDMVPSLKSRKFQFMQLKRPADWKSLRRSELVMFGDSQLHSAIYGSGMPEFVNMEVGGVFRWGSKSWSGFSPPEIYQRIVSDKASQPRVAVMVFLPKYFWGVKSRKTGKLEFENKYRPRPMPKFQGSTTTNVAKTPKTFNATVKIVKTSAQNPNPETLDYEEALSQTSVQVVKGPDKLKGKTILIRHWTMYKGENIKAAGAIRPGQTLSLELTDWGLAAKNVKGITQHMVFNDTDLDMLMTPTYWVTGGPLSPKVLLKK